MNPFKEIGKFFAKAFNWFKSDRAKRTLNYALDNLDDAYEIAKFISAYTPSKIDDNIAAKASPWVSRMIAQTSTPATTLDDLRKLKDAEKRKEMAAKIAVNAMLGKLREQFAVTGTPEGLETIARTAIQLAYNQVRVE